MDAPAKLGADAFIAPGVAHFVRQERMRDTTDRKRMSK